MAARAVCFALSIDGCAAMNPAVNSKASSKGSASNESAAGDGPRPLDTPARPASSGDCDAATARVSSPFDSSAIPDEAEACVDSAVVGEAEGAADRGDDASTNGFGGGGDGERAVSEGDHPPAEAGPSSEGDAGPRSGAPRPECDLLAAVAVADGECGAEAAASAISASPSSTCWKNI